MTNLVIETVIKVVGRIKFIGVDCMYLLETVTMLLLVLQMKQISAMFNQRKSRTLSSDAVQNPRNENSCMAITMRSGKELHKKVDDTRFSKFMVMLKQLKVNVPLVEALEQMLGYAKFMKDLVTKKRTVSYEPVENIHHCSAISPRSLVQKKANLGAFTVPCTIGSLDFAKAFYDLRSSINIMSFAVFKRLGLGDPKPANMWFLMANSSVKKPIRILYDTNDLKFRVNVEEVIFDVCPSMKKKNEKSVFSIIDIYYEDEQEMPVEERFGVEILALVLMNFNGDGIEEYDKTACALIGMGSYTYAPKKMDIKLKNRPIPPAKPSIEKPPVLKLKELSSHLQYLFLGYRNILPIIIVVNLVE
ncbi:uncharacterized protein LOC124887769 [Capsicum annuum]|uniref:uncharacterized protein LOC124887769 n=1 Tax=Capsicum annuum TaxID=4072 RepID=UPI001FB073A5|nr:uncharacterized protein LOC124887769 [Capsicum annuum]